ncbi:Uncharacterised protein [Streptococcus porcinus]|nr:Uncharacterised protein [Streptococcus porcinus]
MDGNKVLENMTHLLTEWEYEEIYMSNYSKSLLKLVLLCSLSVIGLIDEATGDLLLLFYPSVIWLLIFYLHRDRK